jgi:hypothetical protein
MGKAKGQATLWKIFARQIMGLGSVLRAREERAHISKWETNNPVLNGEDQTGQLVAEPWSAGSR